MVVGMVGRCLRFGALGILLALAGQSAWSEGGGPAPSKNPGPRTALVMGVWDYSEAPGLSSLPGIQEDLELMASTLQQLGFETTIVKNPTLAEAKDAVDSFGRALKSRGGTGLFYFTGHGAQLEGRNYLIPRNASLGGRSDLPDEALVANRIVNRMQESGTAVNLLFLDCCRNNLTKSASGTLAPMQAEGIFIGFATADEKEAAATSRGSVYTRALVDQMREPNQSIFLLHTRVTRAVKLRTKGLQVPFQYSGLDRDFVLNGSGVELLPPPKPAAVTTSKPVKPRPVAVSKPVTPPPPTSSSSKYNLTGTWMSNAGQVDIVQTGDTVNFTSHYRNGNTGYFKGMIIDNTINGS